MTEADARLVPMLCPGCGAHVASSGAHQIVLETPTGTLAIGASYARHLCLCGAVSETRQSCSGRLYLVPFRGHRDERSRFAAARSRAWPPHR